MDIKIKAVLLAAAGAAMLPTAVLAQTLPPAVVAIVDRDRVVNQCNACRTATTQIQALVAQAQQRQQTLGTTLQTQGQSLQAEASRIRALPAGAAKTTAEKAFQPRADAFQAQQGAAQQELQGLQQNIQSVNANVLRQINDKLNPIIAQVMQQRGANLAIDQDATLATAKTVDITDQVLASLNTQLTTLSATPLPPQAAAGAPGTAQPDGR